MKTDEKQMKNLDEQFTLAQCKSLFDAIQVNDKITLEANLPETLHLKYSKEQFQQCYLISLQLWKQGVDRRHLKSLIVKISDQNSCSLEESKTYKHMRAKFKHLRFCYGICGEKHHYPYLFNRLTIKMGKFQDAFKSEQYSNIKKLTLQLNFYLNGLVYWQITREISAFKASNTEKCTRYIKDEIDFIRTHLQKEKITSKDFHEMRKVVSRQSALYQTLKVLYPSDYHNEIAAYLSTINGMMGSLHDELILDKFNDESNYYQENLSMPLDIKSRLMAYTQKFSNIF